MENSNEQRKKQEKMLEEKQEQINKLEATMKSVSGEVIKVCVCNRICLCQMTIKDDDKSGLALTLTEHHVQYLKRYCLLTNYNIASK